MQSRNSERSETAYGLTPSKQEPWHLSVRFSQFDTNIDIPAKKKSQLGICLQQIGPSVAYWPIGMFVGILLFEDGLKPTVGDVIPGQVDLSC